MKEFIKKFYGLLTSTKLTLVVLFILVFFMFIGTLFPQGGTYQEYVTVFGKSLYLRLFPFGIFKIFHSWYFITAAVTLYINLLLCSLRGFIIERKKLRLGFEKPIGATEIKLLDNFSSVEDTLKRRGFRFVRIHDDENSISLRALKGMRRRFLSMYYHFFLAITLFGFLLSAFTRFDGIEYFKNGETKYVPRQSKEMGFYKRFANFDTEKVDSIGVTMEEYIMEYIWYKDGYYPKDYKSVLVTQFNGKERKRTIEVNRPLKFKGLTFYQMDYKQDFQIELEDTLLELTSSTPFTIQGIDGSFMIKNVYVGKLFSDDGSITDIIPNAKIYFRMTKEDKWEKQGKLILDESISIMWKDIILRNVTEVSGIYYRRDDGVLLLYISFIFFMLGLFLRVFLPTYEMKLFYDKASQNIYVKGTSSGISAYIDKEIEEIETLLNQGKK
ncbi:MAG: hypothetical protein E3J78_01475 [Candidatus Cloacimonadota bacterium]|nr:MAG: hypothetical protein E3J78_01475 [Candidatus Cloacimonadota bacterium]